MNTPSQPPHASEHGIASDLAHSLDQVKSTEQNLPYQVFMFFMCVIVLGMLILETMTQLDTETEKLFRIIDTVICVIFFIDFLIRLITARNRWYYFFTWGWLDLISAIPAYSVFRTGRFARFIRIIRLLRGITTMRRVLTAFCFQRKQSTALSAVLIAIVTVMFGSYAILECERNAPGSSIHTAKDAIWWVIVTISTVGYGDYYPITDMGRLVGIVLIPIGVGLFATFSGFLAAWLIGRPLEETSSNKLLETQKKLEQELVTLRTENTLLRQVAGLPPSDEPPTTDHLSHS